MEKVLDRSELYVVYRCSGLGSVTFIRVIGDSGGVPCQPKTPNRIDRTVGIVEVGVTSKGDTNVSAWPCASTEAPPIYGWDPYTGLFGTFMEPFIWYKSLYGCWKGIGGVSFNHSWLA